MNIVSYVTASALTKRSAKTIESNTKQELVSLKSVFYLQNVSATIQTEVSNRHKRKILGTV